MNVLSLTTTPDRLKNLKPIIEDIKSQTLQPDIIKLWIPKYYERFDKKITRRNVPAYLKKIENLEINIIEKDYGPGTKLYPCINDINIKENDIIVTRDDDAVLFPEWFEGLVKGIKKFNCVVAYRGRNIRTKDYPYDKSIVLDNVEYPTQCDIVTGCAGVAYKKSFLNSELLNVNPKNDNFYTDDIWISGTLTKNNILKMVIPTKKPFIDIDLNQSTENKAISPLTGTDNKNHKHENNIIEHFNFNLGRQYKRNAVIVTGIDVEDELKYSMPTIEAYCKKFNLTLFCLKNPKLNITGKKDYNYYKFEKNRIYDYFQDFDRILRLDSDILITPKCPDIFKLLPYNKIGAVYEDVGSRKKQRKQEIVKTKSALGDIPNWYNDYINSGVMVASKMHKEIFKLDDHILEVLKNNEIGTFQEQNIVNWKIKYYGFEIGNMGYKFNHMKMFSEKWNNYANPFKSAIIHMAGTYERHYNMQSYYKKVNDMWIDYLNSHGILI